MTRVRSDDVAGRRARAEAILTAAAGLIERWGYDKTTIDEIARAARVGKGTIYLHWRTRDALFAALLRRERVMVLHIVRDSLAAEPEPGPRTLFRCLAAAIIRRPLVRAVLLNDPDVLGRLAERHRSGHAWRAQFEEYLAALRELGAVRADWGTARQVNLVSATFIGALTTAPLMPAELRLSGADAADLIAETICRTLDTGRRLRRRETAAVAQATTGYVERALAVAQREFHEALGPSSGREEQAAP